MGGSKVVLRRKYILIQAFLWNPKKISNNLILYLKEVKEQAKPKVSRRKEIIKIRAEINAIET